MLLRPVTTLPVRAEWVYELKFDGFRGIAIKEGRTARLFSRNRKDLSRRFPKLIHALSVLPCKSAVLDGEIVCLDLNGRPCFESLQGLGPEQEPFLFFYAFDLMHLNGRDTTPLPLVKRKALLRNLLIGAPRPIRLSDFLPGPGEDLIAFARAHKLEGIVAKQASSRYEAGCRSGKWVKFKTYQEDDFLIGGILPDGRGVRAVAIGCGAEALTYSGKVELYLPEKEAVALFEQLTPYQTKTCPFEKLPTKKEGDTWSPGLTKAEASAMVWLEPKIKAKVQFTERTSKGYLRHAQLLLKNR